jgi:hypothetical protein
MPSNHLTTTFLGQPCGSGITEGVNPEMHDRLMAAEKAIRASFDALPPERRIDPFTGEGNATFSHWTGVRSPIVAWIPNAAQHSAGAAVDIEPAANPYIVTRAGAIPGGEPGGEGLRDMRIRALAAYDRAMRFVGGDSAVADVSPRKPGESTLSVWSRFEAVSDALIRYFSVAVNPEQATIARVALENADNVSDEQLLATIGEDERIPLDQTLNTVSREQYVRILRDYEHARIPLVIGTPSAAPAKTRNPAHGFLNLRADIVTALCNEGLRWGACDFEIAPDGSSHNGKMSHFDLQDAGGFPEVHTLLRFG